MIWTKDPKGDAKNLARRLYNLPEDKIAEFDNMSDAEINKLLKLFKDAKAINENVQKSQMLFNKVTQVIKKELKLDEN